MPNRDHHLYVSRISGVAYAGFDARDDEPRVIAARLLGGFIGGDIGGRMPDLIDPPTSPNHRSVGHAVVPIAGVAKAGKQALLDVRSFLKDMAREYEREERLGMAFLCEMCIGIIDGFLAGYVSHLALDATTPAGLPLIK